MKITLTETATRLGRSERQVLYMIRQGKLPAEKLAGRWFIDTDDLPLSENQRRIRERKQQRLKETVEQALDLDGDSSKARYSVQALKAFQIALPIYQKVCSDLGENHAAVPALHRLLEQLCRGCHRYAHADKSECYRAARDEASTALCELMLTQTGAAGEVATTLEQELMPAFAGLLRQYDRFGKGKKHQIMEV
jgi:hypothetical protein